MFTFLCFLLKWKYQRAISYKRVSWSVWRLNPDVSCNNCPDTRKKVYVIHGIIAGTQLLVLSMQFRAKSIRNLDVDNKVSIILECLNTEMWDIDFLLLNHHLEHLGLYVVSRIIITFLNIKIIIKFSWNLSIFIQYERWLRRSYTTYCLVNIIAAPFIEFSPKYASILSST